MNSIKSNVANLQQFKWNENENKSINKIES